MATELRCAGDMYGVLSDNHSTIEVRCKRRKCGAQPGIIVLHTLSLKTGQVQETNIYKDPSRKDR